MTKTPAQKTVPSAISTLQDAEKLAVILTQTAERIQPLFEDLLKRINPEAQEKAIESLNHGQMNVAQAYAEFFQKLYEDPKRLADLQVEYVRNFMTLWQESTKRFMGHPAADLYAPDKGDRRFKSPAWQESALFDFIKRSYLMTSQWMQNAVHDTADLDPDTRRKIEFYTRQFADALSPTNFLLTNPDVIQATLDSKGENLVRGFQNMIDDVERGKGQLKISTTDYKAFTLGKNIATTPGRVVFQNDLMQLIQYAPTTDSVFKTPLLVVPPWINKYYILDLRPDNSFIRWLCDQGHSVFTVSWVNPTPALAQKSFGHYMDEGLIAALDQIKSITGEDQANVIGYCIGGTLLSATLAYLTAQGQKDRVKSATFLTTLIDFKEPGDIKVFIDDVQLALMDQDMQSKGILEARALRDTFALLRANDMIWTFVVNNYLLGRDPFPFDLLYWNDDSTNMPAAMHGFYLRNMYKDNKLCQPGGVELNGTPIDMRSIDTPSYFLSTREDHIAPWQGTYAATQLFKGPVQFTLTASGHVAGVVNHPDAHKYCYWRLDNASAPCPVEAQDWLDAAKQHDGSWWPDWQKWVEPYAGERIPARAPANGLEAAPGSYVTVRTES